uniref:Uncharacterized protein n=1 Tax=Anguilla anguilla TaxID=7936 RepID=A0A0E9VZH9_ANGAN
MKTNSFSQFNAKFEVDKSIGQYSDCAFSEGIVTVRFCFAV